MSVNKVIILLPLNKIHLQSTVRPAVIRSHHEDVDREDNEPIDDIDSPTEAFDESTLTIKKPLRGNIVGMNHYLVITIAILLI